MNNEPITVLIRYRLRSDAVDAGISELTALINTVTASEPACLGITMLCEDGDPSRVLLYERWTDRETYEGPHMKTPHLLRFIERAQQLLAGPPEISFWRVCAVATAPR